MKPTQSFQVKKKIQMEHINLKDEMFRMLLVGPPMLTTSNGFARGANSSCQALAAVRRAAEST